jgi:hypothetical protein
MFRIKKQKVVPRYSGGNIKSKELDNFSGDGLKIQVESTKKRKLILLRRHRN